MGYFYWLCVKNSNDLHTELSLDYMKDTEFYLIFLNFLNFLKSKTSEQHFCDMLEL